MNMEDNRLQEHTVSGNGQNIIPALSLNSNSKKPKNIRHDDDQDLDDDTSDNQTNFRQDKTPDGLLSLKLSGSLHRRLVTKAQQEGVDVNDFAVELLAEGLVLRAWEIMERKQHVSRAPQHGNSNHNHGNGGNRGFRDQKRNHNGGGGNNRRGGMSQSRYNSLMEDKAEFLEYVRNQEKSQR
jgi:hypothetical protein